MAIRFYKRDGWTLDILNQYVVNGRFIDSAAHFGDSSDIAYFVPDVGTNLDIQRLLDEQISEIRRTFNDMPYLSDFQYLELFNWS